MHGGRLQGRKHKKYRTLTHNTHGYSIDLILCLHRLFEKELQYIVNHAKDEYIMLDLTFIDLMAKMQRKFPTVKGYIILTDRQHMPKNSKLHNMLCYEDLLQVQCTICNNCNGVFYPAKWTSSFLGSATLQWDVSPHQVAVCK